MKTKFLLFAILLGLFMACSKDDTTLPKQPDPVQQPDPKPEPEPENNPPGDFDPISPVADNDREGLLPIFSWEAATDPDGDAVTYDLYVDTEENQTKLFASDLNSTTYQGAENLELFATYQWKVVAKDGKGGESGTDNRKFLVKPKMYMTEYDNGNTSNKYSYDTLGLLLSITDDDPRQYAVFYDENRRIKKLVNPKETTTFVYDTENRIHAIEQNNYNYSIAYNSSNQFVSVERRPIDETSNSVIKLIISYENGAEVPSSSLYALAQDNEDGTFKVNYESLDTFEWDENQNLTNYLREENYQKGEGLRFARSFTATYDKKQNPAYDIVHDKFRFEQIFLNSLDLFLYSYNLNVNYLDWVSKNNILTRSDTYVAAPTPLVIASQTEYEYSYTAEGYPSSATLSYVTQDREPTFYKESWKYKP